jgi:predicted NBD/HSP70 family sugar kinase
MNKAVQLYQLYTEYLGATVCTAVALFDPEIIAFGGGVSNDGEFLLAPIREYAKKYAFFKHHAKIVTAELHNDAGIVGAAVLYLQKNRHDSSVEILKREEADFTRSASIMPEWFASRKH